MAEQNVGNVNDDIIPYTKLLNKDIWTKGRLLGRGTFGDVRLYTLKQSNYNIAVKEIRWDPSENADDKIKGFRNEIDSYTKLSHERIVKYFGTNYDTEEYLVFICLEFMPHGSLHACLRKGPFDENRVRKFTKQIMEGVSYLHENLIVHRDIKGANILLDNSDNIKLADFGTSKQLVTMSRGASTRFKGTCNFMAPEVMNEKGAKEYGVKADIWSIGCTIVEMLTAYPPWYPLGEVDVILKVTSGEYPIYTLPAESSEDVKYVLKQCFQQDPSLRPKASELLMMNFLQII